MAIVSDYSQDSDKVLLDLINAENSTSLTLALIEFGLPEAATGSNPAQNTSVSVTATEGSGYTGDVVVQYNRVGLGAFVFQTDLTFQKGDATKIKDLIPELNAKLGFKLGDDDYVDGDLPAFTGTPNEEHDVQVVANPDSLVYIESLTITVKGADIPLSSVITKLILDGLVAPQAPLVP